MNKLIVLFLVVFSLSSCSNKTETETLAKFDKNGNPIVYNEQVYMKMLTKDRNLKVTVIDTFCIDQKAKALNDIKKGKLIYFGFHPREFKKISKILSEHVIEN